MPDNDYQQLFELIFTLRRAADKAEMMMLSEDCDIPEWALKKLRDDALTDILALQIEYFNYD